MIIALNGRFLQKRYLEGIGNYTYQLLVQLVAQQPQHKYLVFLDQEPDIELPNQVQAVVVKPKTRHPLAWWYWFGVKLPALLRKSKVDLLISTDGFCCLHTSVKQVLVIHDLAFKHHKTAISKAHLWFYNRYTPKFIHKAAQVFTVSQFCANDIVSHYPQVKDKIAIAYNGVRDLFAPLPWAEQNHIREQYTGDCNYFLYVGSIHPRKNLITLLKAFSIFKKWQKSNMKLVLAGRMAWKNNEFEQLLSTYKYRADVVLTGYLTNEAVAQLMASCYAFVYPSVFEGFGVPIVEAMRCQVPVLCSSGSGMDEAAGGAALQAPATDVDQWAKQLQLIYKDENLRATLIEKGLHHAAQFNWQTTVQPFIDYIQQVEKN